MNLPFPLPAILERELRVSARRPATYWSRWGVAFSSVVITALLMLTQPVFTSASMMGQQVFRVLAFIAAFAVVSNVVQLASEAFAREKREDTLGLLFLTPLRPVDLVLGKLVSTSLVAFYSFLAVIPALALPFLTGGVGARDFLFLLLALVNFIFLAATLGLFVSAVCWDEKRAVGMASVAMMLVALVIPLLALVAAYGLGWREPFRAMALSPGYAVWLAVVPGRGDVASLIFSLAWTHALGWFFFLAACRHLPRCWQQRPMSLAPASDRLAAPAREKNRDAKTRRASVRHFTSEERAEIFAQNPLLWFARRWRAPATGLWIILLIGALACLPGLLIGFTTGEWPMFLEPGYALFVFFAMNAGLKSYAAGQASFAFARDRGEDTLELLLATPVTPRQLVDGHARALRETLGPWVKRALWIEAGWFAFTLARDAYHGGQHTVLLTLGAAGMLALLVPDLHAVGWLALWRSVVSKNAREAEKSAMGRVSLPWLAVLCVWMLFAGPMDYEFTFFASILVWVATSALVDRKAVREARENLETKLPLWALRRAMGEHEHYDGWRNLGRRLGRWWASRGT